MVVRAPNFPSVSSLTSSNDLINSRKALRSLNRLNKFVPELLVGLVWRKVESVEASVGPGVVGGTAPLLNGVQLRAVRSVQLLQERFYLSDFHEDCFAVP